VIEEPEFLTLDEVLELHQDQIAHYGGDPGIRDPGSLRGRLEAYPALTRCREWIRRQAIYSANLRGFALARSMLKGLSRARHHGARLETTMNLKALFLALALSLPFAAAATTVSSIASADPLPAAQAEKSAPKAHRIGAGKRGEQAKGEHRKGAHRRAEHRKGEHAKGREHRRGGHGKEGPDPRGNGPARPNQGPAKR
jgi:hypothetical protein